MKLVHVHLDGRLEVYLSPDTSHSFPYEAQITSDGTQRRGWGMTPRAAIMDSISERVENEVVCRALAEFVDAHEKWVEENDGAQRGDEDDVEVITKYLADFRSKR